MNKGLEALGNVINNQVHNVNDFGNRNLPLQLGKITNGLGLKLDSVSYTIPSSDYMVSRSALLPSNTFETTETESHTHKVKMPTCFRSIKPGDRVLVAMIGTEHVVIDIVIPANAGAFGG